MTMVGQYEIRELLGAGGIGQVHAAFDTVLQREVALKSLRPELLSDTSFIDRFRAEATNLARFNHPNITTLYTLLSEGGNLYLVMECVRGETLEDLLKKRGGRLSVKESLAIISQVADGLSYAHSMGVIHRDIKPSNVMITPAGLVKIMDFGIARVRGSQRLTRDGSIVGTLAYMAPEQLRGQDADGRSDLYSTAIMLYEMICGSVPFEAATDYDLMQAHVKTAPQRVGSRVAGVDSRIDAALMRALAKKPEQRFSSVREFSDALGATALRTDASQIVHDGTRLINVPELEPLLAPSPYARWLDRLTFIPPDMRMFAVMGAGGAVLVGLAMGLIVLLMPIPKKPPPQDYTTASATTSSATTSPTSQPSRNAGKTSDVQSRTVGPQTSTQSTNGGGTGKTVVASAGSTALTDTGSSNSAASTTGTSTRSADLTPSGAPSQDSSGRGSGSSSTTTSPPSGNSAPGDTGLSSKKEMFGAVERKDFRRAFELAQPLADAGDRDAQYLIGVIFDQGLNGEKDPTQAAHYYEKAAQQNHSKASFNLALLYDIGRGVDKSEEKAFSWYRKAAERDDPAAQNALGICFLLGKGTQESDSDAAYWFRRAADKGFAKAQKNLGDLYYAGRGVGPADRVAAFEWYKKAAAQQDPGAEFAVAGYYEDGRPPVDRDYDKAAEWYRKAAAHGSPKAEAALASMKSRGVISED